MKIISGIVNISDMFREVNVLLSFKLFSEGGVSHEGKAHDCTQKKGTL